MRKHFLTFLICVFFQRSGIFAQGFTDSNLPIVVINTGGQDIDGAWLNIVVDMGIIDNGPGNRNHLTDGFNNYNGKIEIRLQGSSTTQLPKKSYRVTTLNAIGQKTDASLMGLPAEEDWVFKSLYQDKTFLRDELAFRIFSQMGHYSSRNRFFELVVNGDYRGVYQLEEKIKRDKNRVNISKMTEEDNFGDAVTGGYIIALDNFFPGDKGWYSQYMSSPNKDSANYFLYDYPKADSITLPQKDYIKNYFDQYENTLAGPGFNDPVTGYRRFIDVPSFIDNFIINELSRNVDGYRRSSFFYKDRESTGNGKLHAGPVWDFNIAFCNASYNYGSDPYGWAYPQLSNMNFVPFWWARFLNDTSFTAELRCRWANWRSNVLDIAKIHQHIDSMAAFLNESQQRNFARWPIMGQEVYPNPQPIPQSYTEEIGRLKWWFQERITWMDGNIPGVCFVGMDEFATDMNEATVYPNPFNNEFTVSYTIHNASGMKIELQNILGAETIVVYNGNRLPGAFRDKIPTANLADGTYILRMTINDQIYYKKLVKVTE